jgi:hypothetical protein
VRAIEWPVQGPRSGKTVSGLKWLLKQLEPVTLPRRVRGMSDAAFLGRMTCVTPPAKATAP